MRVWLAIFIAVIGWVAVIGQGVTLVLAMTAEGSSVAGAIWRYLSFFTILTNTAVAAIATGLAWRPDQAWLGPRTRLSAAACILIVGIVYSVALRAIHHPVGIDVVFNHVLHDGVPILFPILWFLFRDGSLRWRDAIWAVVPPVIYCVYLLARGAADGFYPYFFMDVATLSLIELIRNIAILSSAFLLFGLILVAIDRFMARRDGRAADSAAAAPPA